MKTAINVIAPLAILVACVLAPVVSAQVTLYTTDARQSQSINNLNALSLTDGSATLVGPFGVAGNMAGLAYDARNGILYGTTTATDNLYSINTSTGTAALIGPLGVPLIHGLAFDNSTGTLFGTYGFSQGDGLYIIDISTGTATLVGNIGFFYPDHQKTVGALAFHPKTGVLYGAINGPGNAQTDGALITISTSTGAGTLVARTPQLSGLAFHPFTCSLYGVHNQGEGDALYTLNIDTALATLVGNTGLSNNLGLEFAGYIVPAPQVVNISHAPEMQSATIEWTSKQGANYIVEKSPDLRAWAPLASQPGELGPTTTYTDDNAISSASFYRVYQTATP
jgi:hypothetical protein